MVTCQQSQGQRSGLVTGSRGRRAFIPDLLTLIGLVYASITCCMDVSEGRKALHHRQARSIHEHKLLSLSLRAGFHTDIHPHAHRLA